VLVDVSCNSSTSVKLVHTLSMLALLWNHAGEFTTDLTSSMTVIYRLKRLFMSYTKEIREGEQYCGCKIFHNAHLRSGYHSYTKELGILSKS